MKYIDIVLKNGQPYSKQFDDIYYSSARHEDIPGESEFRHVFFGHNHLPDRWYGQCEPGTGKVFHQFTIAELGLGSALNCLLTIREWIRHCEQTGEDKALHYVAIEKYPLSPGTISQLLQNYPELEPFTSVLLKNYPLPIVGRHVRHLFDNRVVIHFLFMDVLDALKNERMNVDVWYLDGFSPAKNPEMWSAEVFAAIVRNSHAGTTLSTYTASGYVKRNMQSAGLLVKKVAGHAGKRDMLIASLSEKQIEFYNDSINNFLKFRDKPWFWQYKTAKPQSNEVAVIGAGIVGLSTAYSLIKRGYRVTLIDRNSKIASEASSNPAAVIYPRLPIDNEVDAEFYTQAFLLAVHLLDELMVKSDRLCWFKSGLLQQYDSKRLQSIISKYELDKQLVFPVKNDALCADEGMSCASIGQAGVVLPEDLCQLLLSLCGDRLEYVQCHVKQLKYKDQLWQCVSDAEKTLRAETIVVANGVAVNELLPGLELQSEQVRGQVCVLNENQHSKSIRKTLNFKKYLTPSIHGYHYLGASFQRVINDETTKSDTDELLQKLSQVLPGKFDDNDVAGAWAGYRCMSKDRAPIVGAVPDVDFFMQEYKDISDGNQRRHYAVARHLPGLYVNVAHGSRGFTSCFLSAELIAAQVNNEVLPVTRRVLDYLDPSRFIVNKLKRS